MKHNYHTTQSVHPLLDCYLRGACTWNTIIIQHNQYILYWTVICETRARETHLSYNTISTSFTGLLSERRVHVKHNYHTTQSVHPLLDCYLWDACTWNTFIIQHNQYILYWTVIWEARARETQLPYNTISTSFNGLLSERRVHVKHNYHTTQSVHPLLDCYLRGACMWNTFIIQHNQYILYWTVIWEARARETQLPYNTISTSFTGLLSERRVHVKHNYHTTQSVHPLLDCYLRGACTWNTFIIQHNQYILYWTVIWEARARETQLSYNTISTSFTGLLSERRVHVKHNYHTTQSVHPLLDCYLRGACTWNTFIIQHNQYILYWTVIWEARARETQLSYNTISTSFTGLLSERRVHVKHNYHTTQSVHPLLDCYLWGACTWNTIIIQHNQYILYWTVICETRAHETQLSYNTISTSFAGLLSERRVHVKHNYHTTQSVHPLLDCYLRGACTWNTIIIQHNQYILCRTVIWEARARETQLSYNTISTSFTGLLFERRVHVKHNYHTTQSVHPLLDCYLRDACTWNTIIIQHNQYILYWTVIWEARARETQLSYNTISTSFTGLLSVRRVHVKHNYHTTQSVHPLPDCYLRGACTWNTIIIQHNQYILYWTVIWEARARETQLSYNTISTSFTGLLSERRVHVKHNYHTTQSVHPLLDCYLRGACTWNTIILQHNQYILYWTVIWEARARETQLSYNTISTSFTGLLSVRRMHVKHNYHTTQSVHPLLDCYLWDACTWNTIIIQHNQYILYWTVICEAHARETQLSYNTISTSFTGLLFERRVHVKHNYHTTQSVHPLLDCYLWDACTWNTIIIQHNQYILYWTVICETRARETQLSYNTISTSFTGLLSVRRVHMKHNYHTTQSVHPLLDCYLRGACTWNTIILQHNQYILYWTVICEARARETQLSYNTISTSFAGLLSERRVHVKHNYHTTQSVHPLLDCYLRGACTWNTIIIQHNQHILCRTVIWEARARETQLSYNTISTSFTGLLSERRVHVKHNYHTTQSVHPLLDCYLWGACTWNTIIIQHNQYILYWTVIWEARAREKQLSYNTISTSFTGLLSVRRVHVKHNYHTTQSVHPLLDCYLRGACTWNTIILQHNQYILYWTVICEARARETQLSYNTISTSFTGLLSERRVHVKHNYHTTQSVHPLLDCYLRGACTWNTIIIQHNQYILYWTVIWEARARETQLSYNTISTSFTGLLSERRVHVKHNYHTTQSVDIDVCAISVHNDLW